MALSFGLKLNYLKTKVNKVLMLLPKCFWIHRDDFTFVIRWTTENCL